MKYSINLVRKMREEEKRAERRRLRTVALCFICFGALCLSVFYSTLQILRMERVLQDERNKLARIEAEFRKYQKTKMIVNKADIELLDRLQNSRIFWTKKLAAMAFHLPDNYWITSFGYRSPSFTVDGYGYISPEQKQLITLDNYLNELRFDSTFADRFIVTYLNSTVRKDEQGKMRVSFDFSSENRGARH
jgi:hypothetical protein